MAGYGRVPLFSSLSVATTGAYDQEGMTKSYLTTQSLAVDSKSDFQAALGVNPKPKSRPTTGVAPRKSTKNVPLCLAGQPDDVREYPRVGSRGMWRIHLCTQTSTGGDVEHAMERGGDFAQVIMSATGQLKMLESIGMSRDATRKEIREAMATAKATGEEMLDDYSDRLQRAFDKAIEKEQATIRSASGAPPRRSL